VASLERAPAVQQRSSGSRSVTAHFRDSEIVSAPAPAHDFPAPLAQHLAGRCRVGSTLRSSAMCWRKRDEHLLLLCYQDFSENLKTPDNFM
jgi:hypothetical protein